MRSFYRKIGRLKRNEPVTRKRGPKKIEFNLADILGRGILNPELAVSMFLVIAEAVAKAIQVHMADHGETDLSHANNGGACPDCGGPVEHEGGCCVCHVCGFSECA